MKSKSRDSSLATHWAQLYILKVNYTRAKLACEDRGWELATIDSKAEENQLEKLLSEIREAKKTELDLYFINAKRKSDDSSEFEWNTSPPREMTYTKWFENEPSNDWDKENYVLLQTRDGKYGWNDVSETVKANFVCMCNNFKGGIVWSAGYNYQDMPPCIKRDTNINNRKDATQDSTEPDNNSVNFNIIRSNDNVVPDKRSTINSGLEITSSLDLRLTELERRQKSKNLFLIGFERNDLKGMDLANWLVVELKNFKAEIDLWKINNVYFVLASKESPLLVEFTSYLAKEQIWKYREVLKKQKIRMKLDKMDGTRDPKITKIGGDP